MSKITRQTQKIFGSTAGFDQIAQFGSLAAGSPTFTTSISTIQGLSNYLNGWFDAVEGQNSPAIEDMNALCYLYAYQLAYLAQAGVAEYDSGTTYFTGNLVNNGLYTFTVTSANATLGAVYTNNSQSFTVLGTIASGTNLICVGTGSPTASGILTKSSGTGDATITFSAYTVNQGTFVSLTDTNLGNSLSSSSNWRLVGNNPVWTTAASISDSVDENNLTQYNSNATFTHNMQELRADRAGTTAYNFIYCKNNYTSSPRDVFIVDGVGNATFGNTTDASSRTLTIAANTSFSAILKLMSGSAFGKFELDSSGNLNVNNTTANNLIFLTNNTEWARFLSTGELLVGTTSNLGRLSVAGSTNVNSFTQYNSFSTFSSVMHELRADRAGNTAYKFIYCKNNFTTSALDVFTVDGVGNINIGNTTDAGTRTVEVFASTSSDSRFYLATGANITTIESRGSTSRFDISVPSTFSFTTNKAIINTGSVNNVSTSYTITDVDGYNTILVTTGASGKTITLPAIANNAGRELTIKKVDSGAGTINIAVNGGLIDGASTNGINSQYGYVRLKSDGTNWTVIGCTDFISSTNSSYSSVSANNTWQDTASISLLPGEWEITHFISWIYTSTTFVEVDFAIGTASGPSTAGLVAGDNQSSTSPVPVASGNYVTTTIPPWKARVTANTNYFGKIRAAYTGTAPTYAYRLSARRVG